MTIRNVPRDGSFLSSYLRLSTFNSVNLEKVFDHGFVARTVSVFWLHKNLFYATGRLERERVNNTWKGVSGHHAEVSQVILVFTWKSHSSHGSNIR